MGPAPVKTMTKIEQATPLNYSAVPLRRQVFAWGSWARGRLGLGRPPERTTGRKKKVPRFQATPRRVSGLGKSPIVQVSRQQTPGGTAYFRGERALGEDFRPA